MASVAVEMVQEPHLNDHDDVTKNSKKKKTKTFTGCATCRLRKIKCDLGRPFCKRCKKSGFVCAGYAIQLCWFRPIQFDKYGYQLRTGDDDEESVQKGFQRRNVEFVKYDREYETYEEMDRDLGLLHSPNYDFIEDSQTWMQGPFGVFEGLKDIPSDLLNKRRKVKMNKYAKQRMGVTRVGSEDIRRHKLPHHSTGLGSSEASTPVDDRASSVKDVEGRHDQLFENDKFNHEWLSNELRFDALLSATAATTSNDQTNMFSDLLYPLNSTHGVQTTTTNGVQSDADSPALTPASTASFLHNDTESFAYDKEVFNALRPQSHQQHSLPISSLVEAHNSPNDITIETAESTMPDSIIKIIHTEVLPPLSINVPTTGLQINGLTRFLFDHYMDHVADRMTVVFFPKNPWKTIYFPRAVLALGDLALLGRSSNSRMSLLNALLAVSCFNLQAKFQKGSTEMKFFLNLGIQFRSQASAFLKKMLQGDLNVSNMKSEKYKDVVVAILSMNTIDVVWGTMADCRYHLSLCGDFIAKRMEARPQLSNKAKSLHRIYSFLRLLQDSTSFQNLSNTTETQARKLMRTLVRSNDNDHSGGEFQESIDAEDGLVGIEFVNKAGTTALYQPDFIAYYHTSATSKSAKEVMLTEAMYGMPNSLILLYSEAVKLLKLRLYFEKHGSKEDQAKLKDLCTRYEKKLIDWNSEWELQDESGTFLTGMHEGLYHHMHSFHNGLIVYYFTLVRELGDIFLQKYCVECVTHLEQLQCLYDEQKVMIIPMFWQGFIAGCSATESRVQFRFREWAAKLALGGVGTYWGARQLMFEVWRRRRNSEPNENWLSVHRDWEMNVMLP